MLHTEKAIYKHKIGKNGIEGKIPQSDGKANVREAIKMNHISEN